MMDCGMCYSNEPDYMFDDGLWYVLFKWTRLYVWWWIVVCVIQMNQIICLMMDCGMCYSNEPDYMFDDGLWYVLFKWTRLYVWWWIVVCVIQMNQIICLDDGLWYVLFKWTRLYVRWWIVVCVIHSAWTTLYAKGYNNLQLLLFSGKSSGFGNVQVHAIYLQVPSASNCGMEHYSWVQMVELLPDSLCLMMDSWFFMCYSNEQSNYYYMFDSLMDCGMCYSNEPDYSYVWWWIVVHVIHSACWKYISC